MSLSISSYKCTIKYSSETFQYIKYVKNQNRIQTQTIISIFYITAYTKYYTNIQRKLVFLSKNHSKALTPNIGQNLLQVIPYKDYSQKLMRQ